MMAEAPSKDWKNEITYPSFTLSCKKVPELYDATVGDMVTLTVKGVVTRVEKSSSKSNDRHDITIDMHTVGASKKGVSSESESNEDESYEMGEKPKSAAARKMAKSKMK